jgi:hypothetical protein
VLHAGRNSRTMRFTARSHGACLVELHQPGVPGSVVLPSLAHIPLPAGERFLPTDAMRTGPHKYFIAEAYSGQRESVWKDKKRQLETLCEYIKGRWEDQHASVKDLPYVKDITQIVGAAALIFTAGEGRVAV